MPWDDTEIKNGDMDDGGDIIDSTDVFDSSDDSMTVDEIPEEDFSSEGFDGEMPTLVDSQDINATEMSESNDLSGFDGYADDTSSLTEPLEEEELDYDSDADESDPAKVLRRDPTELWQSGVRAIDDVTEAMRDDLRDKGMEDGPQMEAIVMHERALQMEELTRNIEGDFSQPYTLPDFSTYFPTDSTAATDTGLPDASTDETEVLDEEELNVDDSSVDSSSTASSQDTIEVLDEDSLDETQTDYPSGFDYSNVKWDEVQHEIDQEQADYEESLTDSTTEVHTDMAPSDELQEEELIDSPSGFDYSNVDWDKVYKDIEQEQQEYENSLQDTPDDSALASEPVDTPTENDASQNDTSTDVSPVNDVSEWLGDINPNFDEFDPESPYCNNCGSCAFAVYQRFEGSTDSCASADNIGYNSEMEALTGMDQVSMSPDEIEQRLLAEGDGAHAIIGIDRAQGPGHWFNAACINGKVVAIDGQSGEIRDWPPDYGDVVNWEMSVKRV